jgi:hypothetical protein
MLFSDMQKAPSMNSVTRWRAFYQNDMKMYQPTDEDVIRKRYANKKKWILELTQG